jgi:hypothetical protein
VETVETHTYYRGREDTRDCNFLTYSWQVVGLVPPLSPLFELQTLPKQVSAQVVDMTKGRRLESEQSHPRADDAGS